LLPAWERVNAAAGAGFDKLFEAFAATQQRFQKAGEFIPLISRKPRRGHFAERPVHDFFGEVLNSFDPGSEIGNTANVFVNDWTEEQTEEGGVAELPVGAIEEIAVIHHLSDETDLKRVAGSVRPPVGEAGTKENGLPGIRVSGPLVESQDTKEVLRVGDLLHQRIGEYVINRLRDRVTGESGAEMPAGSDFAARSPQLDIDFGEFTKELRGDFNDASFGLGDIEMGEENG